MSVTLYKTKVTLRDATAFSQYIIGRSLITIIGELHNKLFECKGETVSISDYIADILNTNESSMVILEYQKDRDDVGSLLSKTIVDTYRKVIAKDKIEPFDNRNAFLGEENHFRLYNDPNLIYLTKDDIYYMYMKPFYDKAGEYLSLDGHLYQEDAITFLYNNYSKSINNELDNLSQNLNSMNNDIIIHKLKFIWAKVADFYVFKVIMAKKSPQEIIVLAGHNIRHVLKILKVREASDYVKPCIPLKSTFRVLKQ